MGRHSSNIHRLRNTAFGFILIGFLILYAGIIFKQSTVLMTIFFFLGFLLIMASTVIYFLAGMLSARAVRVNCPACQKPTKVAGKTDVCMHCREPLTVGHPTSKK